MLLPLPACLQVTAAGGSFYPADMAQLRCLTADLASSSGYPWRAALAADVPVSIAAPPCALGGLLLGSGKTVATADGHTVAIGGVPGRLPSLCLPSKDAAPCGPLFVAVELTEPHPAVTVVPGLGFMQTGQHWLFQLAQPMVQLHTPSQVSTALAASPDAPQAAAVAAARRRQEEKREQRQQRQQRQPGGAAGAAAAATPAMPTPAEQEAAAPDSGPSGSGPAGVCARCRCHASCGLLSDCHLL